MADVKAEPQPAKQAHASAAGSAPVSATQYYGTITVGTPGQKFRVLFDTQSGEMILPSTKCEDAACNLHTRFDAKNSTSVLNIGWADDPTVGIGEDDDRDTKSLTLLGADVTGEFMRDRVCMGTYCGVADFVALSEESEEPFSDLEFDGVVGLAPTSPDADEFNVMKAIWNTSASKLHVFGIYLQPSGKVRGGELHLGGYRYSQMANHMVWAPMSSNESWQVVVDDITVGGESTNLCGDNGCNAAVDSGSSLVMMPGNLLGTLLTKLGIDNACSSSPPPLGFSVQGRILEIHAEDYIEHTDNGCQMMLAPNPGSSKGALLTLGYPFLRRHYTAYDLPNKQIGFARTVHDHQEGVGKDDAGITKVDLVGVRP